RLSLLSAAEEHQLRGEWQGVGANGEPGLLIHERIAGQAAQTPDAVALVSGGERLTYGELWRRSEALAGHLRALGVGPEERVAVCLERSPTLVISLLAVLAAGGAYVPLDPGYPAARRELMLADSGAVVLITRSGAAWTEVELPRGVTVVDLDAGGQEGPSGSQTGLQARPADSRHLAYVIYTSGSTGRPKGVAIEHRSVAALAGWAREVFSLEELAGTLAATSVCFDLSVFELFVPLAWGGRVILAENALALPGLPLANEVALANTVPSAAAEWVRRGDLPVAVRTVNLAGEALPGELVAGLYGTGTVERVLNLYGPSEDTTYSTWALQPRLPGGRPSIGRPIAGSQAYLLDLQGELVPVGIAGELWLGGDGLARGYHGRPDLTAERFLPDPFSGRSGARLYRTGDLGRLRADGEIDFLGRIDHQVKVRGFRIELGEIEAALLLHPGVSGAAVLVQEIAGDRRLVACVVGIPATERRKVIERGAEPPSAVELRSFLQERLPAPMVPGRYLRLAALPLSANGKLDRRALERLAGEAVPASPPALLEARGPIEELIAGIWCEALGREQVGVEEDFFALGGHSLLATRVLARLQDLLGVELPLRRLFEAPTVAALARAVEAARAEGGEIEVPPLLRHPTGARPTVLPLSFAQERLWFLDRLEPGSAAYNIPAALRLRGPLDLRAYTSACSEIVRRHEILRTTFSADADGVVQVVATHRPQAVPVVDLTALPGPLGAAEVRALTAAEALRPFDLARGPLLRTPLLRLADEDHIGFFHLHHIVADGWSLGVLLRELRLLYGVFSGADSASPLPELDLQYGDFVLWQRGWLTGEALERQLRYWRESLAAPPLVLELPTDRPRAAARRQRGGRRDFLWSMGWTRSLGPVGRGLGATPFMVLLSGFSALLSRLSGQADLLVGSPIANRRRGELEGLIGCFVNTLVLRADLKGDPTLAEAVGRTREIALGAFAHQDLPFERLVEALAPERESGRSPFFQALFTLQNAPLGPLELPGLAAARWEIPESPAKFDLSLSLSEVPEGLSGS
ncbi:MAG TPA: amino acid adenylation domain-containing protein, partial [Thermoanaerobaculia bacterium]|nr:amino acid adenylation domain-containing protein [Thermoanaerobaculia bacterium]